MIAGRSGWKNPKLAAAANQIGGNAVVYLCVVDEVESRGWK